jgi:hypothetical protein|tara:strand:+ start:891 stop:1085 length:195 start_codon:yes stop_codon:yes gene_type:complete
MAKVKIEVTCDNIMLDEMRYSGWKGEVDKAIVDAVNAIDDGYGSPRIKVEAKKKPTKKPTKKAV